MEGNSCKRNYFIDSKHTTEKFNAIDSHGWENRSRTRKLLLNLIETSKNNYILGAFF